MISTALYKREMKRSIKLLLICCAVMTMYIAIIISMYKPELAKMLDKYVELMPELMASFGMTGDATTLTGFMCSYLYGFILLIIPMLFSIIRGNGLIAGYVDKGSMVSLLSAPLKRRTVVLTQMAVLISGILLLNLYITAVELFFAEYDYPDQLHIGHLLSLNTGLLFLHLFIGSICFTASCVFSDTKYSVGAGAGIPVLMYILKMLANMGDKADNIKYLTFFTLFNPDGIVDGELKAVIGIIVLLTGAVILFTSSVVVFCRKDLNI